MRQMASSQAITVVEMTMKTALMFFAVLALTFIAATYPQKPSYACDPSPCGEHESNGPNDSK